MLVVSDIVINLNSDKIYVILLMNHDYFKN